MTSSKEKTALTKTPIEKGELPSTRFRSHVSDLEKETIINYNEAETEADIYTYNKALQKRLEQILKIKPYANDGLGGKSYKIDKKRIPLPRAKREMSEKAKKAAGERLKNTRFSRRNTTPAVPKQNGTPNRSSTRLMI